MYLEFFVTEPLETLVKKRASLPGQSSNHHKQMVQRPLLRLQHERRAIDHADNHDTLGNSFHVYEIASDDAGESRPAYLAEKVAVFPVQSEVTALDYYIRYFVWGGLQRTTNESSSYGVYGVPDWNNLRTNNTLSLGRGYDYPHITVCITACIRWRNFIRKSPRF